MEERPCRNCGQLISEERLRRNSNYRYCSAECLKEMEKIRHRHGGKGIKAKRKLTKEEVELLGIRKKKPGKIKCIGPLHAENEPFWFWSSDRISHRLCEACRRHLDTIDGRLVG